MMKIISHPKELQAWCLEQKSKGHKIGFVPTMGALHGGHLSLIEQSKKENSVTVLSIFVNPTQFNNPNDFTNYPRTLERDLEATKAHPVDVVFAPEKNDLYPDNYNYSVVEKEKNQVLCGATRPGHFEGVLTIIIKLLNITQAHKMYLGEKDYQQLEIIRGMAKAFFITTEIIGCPTVRDEFGLALSSRNERLNQQGIDKARTFAKILKTKKPLLEVRHQLDTENIKVDYLEEMWGRRFAAVFIDDVRLIDNVPL